MPWISIADNPLLTGVNAEGIQKFFESVHRAHSSVQTATFTELVEMLAEGAANDFDFVPDPFRPMIQRVADKLLDTAPGRRLRTLMIPIRLLADSGGGEPVDVVWPHGEWTADLPIPVGLPVTFKMKASAGLKFAVGTDSGDDPIEGTTAAQLALKGEMNLNIGAGMPLAAFGSLEAEVQADTHRQLVYFLIYDQDLWTWRAMADAFGRVRRLDDFDATLAGFQEAIPQQPSDQTPIAIRPLSAISLSGGDSLMVRAGATLRIPLANYGTLRGRAGGRITLGNGFTLRISERPKRDGAHVRPPALVVEAATQYSFDKEGEAGIGYGFGIADLTPDAAQSLLNAVVSSKDILESVDTVLGDASQSFLKPGTLLKTFLTDRFKERADGDDLVSRGLRIAFGDVLGLDADGDITKLSGQVGDWIGSLLDNTANLFGSNLSEKIRSVLAPITDKVEDAVKDKIEEIADAAGEKLEDYLNKASTAIDDGTHKAINELLDKSPEQVLSDLRAFLNTAREKLNEIAAGIEAGNLDLIAGEIAWSLGGGHGKTTGFTAEIEEEGRDFYRSVIWRPRIGAGRLIDSKTDDDQSALPGVTRIEAMDQDSDRRFRGRQWNVGLIDTPFSESFLGIDGRRRRFADAKVERTLSGVSVGKDSWNRVRREISLFWVKAAEREILFADFLGFVNAGGDDAGTDRGVATARVSLSFTHEERRFGPDEIKRFAVAFRDGGLVGQEAASALIDLQRKATAPDGSQPKADARALLMIPPDRAVDAARAMAPLAWAGSSPCTFTGPISGRSTSPPWETCTTDGWVASPSRPLATCTSSSRRG